jgi:hypothetical protein
MPKASLDLEPEAFAPARTTGSFALPGGGRRIEPMWGTGGATSAAPVRLGSQASGPPAHQSFPSLALEVEADNRSSAMLGPGIELDIRAVPTSTRALSVGRAPKRTPRAQDAARTRPRRAGRSWLGALFGWLLLAAAIVALGYVASAVFKRPDARKHRKAVEALAPEPPVSP